MEPTIPPPEPLPPAPKSERGRPRVALYTRVSTEDQATEGFSLDAQIERLRSYAKAQHWRVVGEFVDGGYSGRRVRRPQYQAMMAAIETWDVLLVLKMDRIHRNSRNFMAMMDHLRLNGKEFASMTENLDTSTAMGRFVMDIIQRIAQLESDQTGERTQMGMHQKARTRVGVLGPAAYGIQIHNGAYKPKPREVPVVAMIFERCLAGYSLTEIASALNAQRIRSRRGSDWNEVTVRNVLRSPALVGIRIWGRYILTGHHEPVVDIGVFMQAQEILDRQGIVVAHLRKSPDFAAKRAEALRAIVEGRSYHAEFDPSHSR